MVVQCSKLYDGRIATRNNGTVPEQHTGTRDPRRTGPVGLLLLLLFCVLYARGRTQLGAQPGALVARVGARESRNTERRGGGHGAAV